MFDEFIFDLPEEQCLGKPLPDLFRDKAITGPDGLPGLNSPSMFYNLSSQPSPPSGRSSGSHSVLSMDQPGSNASTETSASSPSNTANVLPGGGTDVKSDWMQPAGQEAVHPAEFQGTINPATFGSLSAIENMIDNPGHGFGGPPDTASGINSPFSNPNPGEYFASLHQNQHTKMPPTSTQALPSPPATSTLGDFNGSFQVRYKTSHGLQSEPLLTM